MSVLRPARHPQSPSLDEYFLERYAELLRVAIGITSARREAEDLVQDAFVRVLLARPDTSDIENIDAYLRAVLRNLHTARLRRLAHRIETPLSIVEFDSAHFAARALSPSKWVEARHDVAAACHYACARRLTSKTASLFLLRFVHEYAPGEIVQLAKLTRDAVDMGLARSRAEVRAYLVNPAAALDAIGIELLPMAWQDITVGDEPDYVAALRATVFGVRHRQCFDRAFLQPLYARDADRPLPTEVLAEIVTCPSCLDLVNRMSGLPQLSERHPSDPPPPPRTPTLRLTLGGARRDRQPSGSQRVRLHSEQSLRAVRAHRPRTLHVLVNGFEVGAHEISGRMTRAMQTLSVTEPIRLIELYSEQQICLATMHVLPAPDAPAEQHVSIDLDDDRRAALSVSFLAPWPKLQIVYDDPRFVEQMEAMQADGWEEAPAPASLELELAPQPWSFPWWLPRPAFVGWLVAVAIVGWLFFFTPGASVSAAERLWRALTSWLALQEQPARPPFDAPTHRDDIALPPSANVGRGLAIARVSPTMLSELEVDVLTLLQGREALVGQRIHVARAPAAVMVSGLVEGADRQDLVSRLRAMPNSAALRVDLETPEELATATTAGARGPTHLTFRLVDLQRDAIPAADHVRRSTSPQEIWRLPFENTERGRARSFFNDR